MNQALYLKYKATCNHFLNGVAFDLPQNIGIFQKRKVYKLTGVCVAIKFNIVILILQNIENRIEHVHISIKVYNEGFKENSDHYYPEKQQQQQKKQQKQEVCEPMLTSNTPTLM
jgi:hypothetical protein